MRAFGKARAVAKAELTTPGVSHRLLRVERRHRRTPPPGRRRRSFVLRHGMPEDELVHHALELQACGLMHAFRAPWVAPESRPMRGLDRGLRCEKWLALLAGPIVPLVS